MSRLAGVSYQNSIMSIGSRIFIVGGTVSGFEPYAVDLCPGDYNNTGDVTTDDLFGYLNDWFYGSQDANMDGAAGAPDINDLMVYFNMWMTPCSE